jgi:sulfite exporter TauE/SafE/copper chaperone CopZ
MTCANCEKRIEKKLRATAGVLKAQASWRDGTLEVSYDPEQLDHATLSQVLDKLGYRLYETRQGSGGGLLNPDTERIFGLLLLVAVLFFLLQHFNVSVLFTEVPIASEGMGYLMLLVIGLLTSVHCVGMCGGIVLTQSLPGGAAAAARSGGGEAELGEVVETAKPGDVAAAKPKAARQSAANDAQKPGTLSPTLRPALLYNLGRVVSYAVIGAILGGIAMGLGLAAGSGISAGIRGIIQLIAGLFMLVMGLNMLGIFPWLKRFNIRLPEGLTRRIDALGGRSNSPLIIGLLNGLMPCGPLQAMQLFAFSTGNPLVGGLSMLFFALGTVPLMFGLGALSSLLSGKFTRMATTVGAVLVCVLGLMMFSYGLNLTGWGGWQGSASASASSSEQPAEVVIEDGYQIVNSTLSRRGYPSITVEAGIPVRWNIQADASSINGCNGTMVIPEYGIEHSFTPGDNIIEFTPEKPGRYRYTCWMGMISGTITVQEAQ